MFHNLMRHCLKKGMPQISTVVLDVYLKGML